jgi:anti-sigma factor RsiW
MTCETVDALLEEIAAGEPMDTAVESHVATCPRCTAALALARRVDAAIAARPQPAVPSGFSRAVMARIRRERWREEERFDRAFNVGLAAAAVLIVGGVAASLNLAGIAAVLLDTSSALAQGTNLAVGRFAGRPEILASIAGLCAAGALVWWWAEHREAW